MSLRLSQVRAEKDLYKNILRNIVKFFKNMLQKFNT